MYESRHQAPAHPEVFRRRVALHVGVALAVLVVSLGIGIAGYVGFEGLSCIDAYVDAAMLLGGMGPVHTPMTFAGKLFAGAYALYAGLVFLVCATLMVSPFAHRLLHRFHWSGEEQ